MKDDQKKLHEEIALFRYGLIADLLHLGPHNRGLYHLIYEKGQRDYTIPGSLRRHVAPETIRGWFRLYQKGGFDALRPKMRADCGASHAIPQALSDHLLSLKEEVHERSVRAVIEEAGRRGFIPQGLVLAPSTVHRLLARHGLMEPKPTSPDTNDRRRFSFPKAGDLWMSDVMHGPAVPFRGKARRTTYLIAFLDDATRLIPHAAFAFSENTAAFLPLFKTAIERRGIPKRLFVDNGAAYRSHHLALVCAKLGVTLIHARPFDPAAKGKQERWFRTVRMQLLPTLTDADLSSLEALNRKLWTYVEGEYHHAPHRGIEGQTPFERWARLADEVRLPGHDLDLDDLFLFEQKRRVHKDRTVSLNGTLYEVDASLVGSTVTLRYDPSRPGAPVQVFSQGGGRPPAVHEARVVDSYSNCFVKRARTRTTVESSRAPKPPPPGLKLRELRGSQKNTGKEGR